MEELAGEEVREHDQAQDEQDDVGGVEGGGQLRLRRAQLALRRAVHARGGAQGPGTRGQAGSRGGAGRPGTSGVDPGSNAPGACLAELVCSHLDPLYILPLGAPASRWLRLAACGAGWCRDVSYLSIPLAVRGPDSGLMLGM